MTSTRENCVTSSAYKTYLLIFQAQTKFVRQILQSAKIEWLLGCSVEQMSRLKALEVLGISSAMLEEEKARILGSLGVKAWGNPGSSAVIENPQVGSCLSRKRRNTASEAPRVPAPVCGMAAPSPSEVSCLSSLRTFTFRTWRRKDYLQGCGVPTTRYGYNRSMFSLFQHIVSENNQSRIGSTHLLPCCSHRWPSSKTNACLNT